MDRLLVQASEKKLHSYSNLKNLCNEILKDADQYSKWPQRTRAQATKNRSRSLLLAETQKIAEKYNKIGDKYKFQDSQTETTAGSQKKLISWPKDLKSFKLKELPSHLRHVNISLLTLANPDPYSEENPVFPQITVDELRKLQKSMKNGSMKKILEKYKFLAEQNRMVEAAEIVHELDAAMAERQLDSLDSIISEYDGFDAAIQTTNSRSVVASAEMLKKFKVLHFQAAAAIGNFDRLITAINTTLGISCATSCDESTDETHDDEICSIHAEMGPLKLMSRSVEKAVNDYGSDPCQILDFLRASAYCNSVKALNKVLSFLLTTGQKEHGVCILRVKNGFESIAAVNTYGYRDIKVNLWVPCDPVLVQAGRCFAPERAGIIAEIQLHLKEMYDVKASIGHMMYTWVRKFDVAGITSPEILLTFGVSAAEATVALCAENVKKMIECAESDPESNRCAEIDSRLWDEDVEPFLNSADKEDLRLSNEFVAMNIMTSHEHRHQMDERIGREAETLAIFVKYRSSLMGVELNDYHLHLAVEVAKCVRPLRDLALGRLPMVVIPDSHLHKMSHFILFLEEALGMTPELLNLLRHLNEGYCRGRSFHLMRAISRVALKIYGSPTHPMYLACVVNVFHSSMWGMFNYFNAFLDDVLLNYSTRHLENVKTSSKIIILTNVAEEQSTLGVELVGKFPQRLVWYVLNRCLVILALPLYPLRLFARQEDRQILLAPLTLRYLYMFGSSHSDLLQLGLAHPLCSKKSVAWIAFVILQLDTIWVFIGYTINQKNVHVKTVDKSWLSFSLIILSVSALLAYVSLNPHRRPRPSYRYLVYLGIMRSYLLLSIFSLVIAIYALAVLGHQELVSVTLSTNDSHNFIEISVDYIFFVWILLAVINILSYLQYRQGRVVYKSLSSSINIDIGRTSSVDTTNRFSIA